jgi:polysaccharide export outer membrane protein
MLFNLNTALKRCTVVAFLPFVVACANMESGMRIDTARVPSTNAQPQATPEIKLITPDLLRSEKRAKAQQSTQNIDKLIGQPKPYVIGNGDLLSILVWDHPELNIAAAGAQALSASAGAQGGAPSPGAQTPAAFAVDQQGFVQFPYVGSIKLAGLTEMQARDLLAQKLIKSIKKPDITLRVLAFRSKKVFVDGEVKAPGNQAIDDVPMTLLESLTRAGGMLPTADQSYILVTRNGVSYPINIPELVRQGINPSSIMLMDNDVVRVRSRDENKVYVLGEVQAPKALPMNNGRLTLTQALGEAGGLSQLSASSRQVYVVRNADQAEPVVYNLDAQSPVALALAENFELNPRDVVFIDASGLARFSRLVSLIIPSAAATTSGYGQVK